MERKRKIISWAIARYSEYIMRDRPFCKLFVQYFAIASRMQIGQIAEISGYTRMPLLLTNVSVWSLGRTSLQLTGAVV